MDSALGMIIGVIFFIVILGYGFSAIGDAYQGGGCLGVIAIVVLVYILAAFGL